jgi:hypothetical protein
MLLTVKFYISALSSAVDGWEALMEVVEYEDRP